MSIDVGEVPQPFDLEAVSVLVRNPIGRYTYIKRPHGLRAYEWMLARSGLVFKISKNSFGEPASLLAPQGVVAISVFVRARRAWPR